MIESFLGCLGRFLYAVLVRVAALVIVALIAWLIYEVVSSHLAA